MASKKEIENVYIPNKNEKETIDFYKSLGCRQIGLGFQKMPPGYILFLNSDGTHYFWLNYKTDIEGVIFCYRWDCFKSAWLHYKKHAAERPETRQI